MRLRQFRASLGPSDLMRERTGSLNLAMVKRRGKRSASKGAEKTDTLARPRMSCHPLRRSTRPLGLVWRSARKRPPFERRLLKQGEGLAERLGDPPRERYPYGCPGQDEGRDLARARVAGLGLGRL